MLSPRLTRASPHIRIRRCFHTTGQTQRSLSSLHPDADHPFGLQIERNLSKSPFADAIDVLVSPTSGRGIYAMRNIPAGESIIVENPFAEVLRDTENRCHRCWKPNVPSSPQCTCDLSQLSMEYKAFFDTRPRYQELCDLQYRHIEEDGSFPILITNIIGRILHDLTTKGSFDSMVLINQLVHGNEIEPAHIPETWQSSYRRIQECILTEPGQAELFSLPWYARKMTMLNLNVFRVFLPDQAGAALYILSSFLNHSCVPNAHPFWRDSNAIEIQTVRDIRKGEELLISYTDIDQFKSDQERNGWLQHMYGFSCRCQLCQRLAHSKNRLTRNQ
ncbi:uncharacterized protein BJ171DRAFT_133632 [Polychytrium aggregatum]|uniref:uncharacterized protein n=1 Tax=Polychytrium aggregatum TaxID=110093 RepID=UPI0022FF21B3|nr:uncharacterized protein BJ171DRAFT_133632 [Polychytrium aggregatum]KAI9203832.1 hypothetical protein BJ171DRAFT_133632 [Polychytrium aggregatum]